MNKEEPAEHTTILSNKKIFKLHHYILGGFISLVLLAAGAYALSYFSTSAHLRNPTIDHYHFRAQVIVNNIPVDFSEDKFQEEYSSASCSAGLASQPIDFHDNMDQMAHVHWRGITGGEFLKFYGWNLINGSDHSLGRRYDQSMINTVDIKTAGQLLPELPKDAEYYVYTGDEDEYQKKDWDEFLKMDLQDYLGQKSQLNRDDELSFNFLDFFSKKTYAHDGVIDDNHDEASEDSIDPERLKLINNLIGNIVIFVQEDEPTNEQIRDRFNNLMPLHDSVCGG